MVNVAQGPGSNTQNVNINMELSIMKGRITGVVLPFYLQYMGNETLCA